MSKLFSKRLIEKINDRLYKGEQVMLFLNRRGYATQMLCPECGYVSVCDHCSVAHTYHKKAGELICHLCGDVKRAPDVCPQCGRKGLRYTGVGTEKVETIARGLFPMARVERMDSDTMTAKDSYRKVLDDFRVGRIHVLIGTQMIAKGLDFPNVTLVGVMSADVADGPQYGHEFDLAQGIVPVGYVILLQMLIGPFHVRADELGHRGP